MSEWFSGDIVVNDLRIHYYRTGGDKPPVVLSHGATDNGLCWTRVAESLEKDYDVIMYDARWHGLTKSLEGRHPNPDMSADLAGLIRALGLEKPSLIGHSMGAMITAMTAANYPELVRCAILEDPGWRSQANAGTPEEWAAMVEQWRANILKRKSQTREEIIAAGRAEHPDWAEIEWGPWADAKLQVSPDIFKGFSALRAPWQEVVRKIRCPILLITGDPELGAIVTAETAEEAASIWNKGRIAHISGAGHNIRRERYEDYMKVVTAFLKEV